MHENCRTAFVFLWIFLSFCQIEMGYYRSWLFLFSFLASRYVAHQSHIIVFSEIPFWPHKLTKDKDLAGNNRNKRKKNVLRNYERQVITVCLKFLSPQKNIKGRTICNVTEWYACTLTNVGCVRTYYIL